MRTSRTLAHLALVLTVGCGGAVEALDARDPTLPLETRAWIASAEDGVIVARAELDVARVRLHRTERWVEDREDAFGALAAFEPLAEARLAHARAELDEADARAALAEAKRTLVYAESAVRHDRGDHDLEPIRAEVESLRERMHEAAREASARRTAAEDAARGFWSAYAEHAASGADTTAFWTAGLD